MKDRRQTPRTANDNSDSRYDQHPLQIFFIFLSTFEFWAFSSRIAASPGMDGPGVTVPSIRPFPAPPARFPAVPLVLEPRGPEPLPAEPDPEEFAVPKAFVPGAVFSFDALPAPLGSLPELFKPPALAGPEGTPLTP
jgi:hypothetical protein